MLIRHRVADLLATGVAPLRIAHVERDHPLLHGQSLESLVLPMRRWRLRHGVYTLRA